MILNGVYRVRRAPSILELVGVDRWDGKRPDGITVFPLSNGKSLCTDTYAYANIFSSAVLVEHAAQEAEERKRRKYGALGVHFRCEPVAVETTGVYGESVAALISQICRRITEATGESTETLWLEQRFGLAVLRGNTLSLLTAVTKT